MDGFLEFAIGWLPLLVMIGALLFVATRAGKTVPKDYLAMASAQLDEMRRQNQTLERIATALEKAAEKGS